MTKGHNSDQSGCNLVGEGERRRRQTHKRGVVGYREELILFSDPWESLDIISKGMSESLGPWFEERASTEIRGIFKRRYS